jgi:hypothetical protein
MERLDKLASTARFSETRSIGQSAISLSVRRQPPHQPVAGSIRQIPVQGLGGCCMRSLYYSQCRTWPEDCLGPVSTHLDQSASVVLFGITSNAQYAQIGVAAELLFAFCTPAARAPAQFSCFLLQRTLNLPSAIGARVQFSNHGWVPPQSRQREVGVSTPDQPGLTVAAIAEASFFTQGRI